MTQLMSGVINTSAFPTAPTCPTWLPFLLMSRLGQVASRPGCVQTTSPGPYSQPDLAQGPTSTSGSYTELQVHLLQAACPDSTPTDDPSASYCSLELPEE